MSKITRAVIYARFSSNNQREESIDAQVRICKKYANENEMLVSAIYADHAKSGTTDNRDEFQRMISDSKTGAFNVVLVSKLDRFGRDGFEALFYKRQLMMHGVELVSTVERLGDDPESAMMEYIYFGMAEYYSRNLAREVKKGLHENALKGIFNGGLVPFGFRLNEQTRKLEIEEHEAAGVRMVFDLYLSGVGYGGIADQLNDAGYRARSGKPFTKGSLHGMLINEKYCGKLYYGKIAPKDWRKKRNHHKFNEEYLVIEGGCPAIISEEVFSAAQEKLGSRKRGKRCDAKVNWMLSGLLHCEECGETMIVKPRTSKRADGTIYKNYYYACPNRDCSTKSIPKELIEQEVIRILNESLPDESIHDLAVQMCQPPEGSVIDFPAKIRAAQAKLNNLSAALADGAPWAAIAPAWQAAEEEKHRLEKAQIAAEQQIGTLSVSDAEKFLRRFGALTGLDEEQQREVLQRNIKKITVNRSTEDKKTWAVRVIVNPKSAPMELSSVGVYGGTASPVPRNPVGNGWVFCFI